MNELYSPGPDGPANDNWNVHPLGKDAPQRRLSEDAKNINGQIGGQQ